MAAASETTTATAAGAAPPKAVPTRPPAVLTSPPRNERLFDPDASIVLIGCRGAGKRTLGFIGALHLRRRLVTEDHYFAQVTGESRGQFLGRHGREAFARRNAEVFARMLEANRRRCIIECGLSSLSEEGQAALRAYCKTNPVVYVHREREQVLRFLDEHDADQLLRADQRHRQCSNLEYYNLYDASGGETETDPAEAAQTSQTAQTAQTATSSSRLLQAKADFTRYLDLLQGQAWRRQWAESPFLLNAVPPELRAYSYALRLRLSYLVDMDLAWEDFEARGDCVELIVDHWPDDLHNVIARQVALIRRHVGVPIIFHVEENPREERSRPREERDRTDTELLALGLRLNVEYVSLDLQRSPALVAATLAQRGRSSVVGNFWYPGLGAPKWSDEIHVREYARAQALGCDVVRIGRFCLDGPAAEEPAVLKALLAARVPDPKPPLAAFDYSLLGVRTPLQGRVLNPVKHPSAATRRDHLATVSSAAAAMQIEFTNGRLDTLQFYTIGSHIHYSITPAITSAAFAFAGLPHGFQAAECATLHELQSLVFTPGGVSGHAGNHGGNHGDTNASFGGATLAAPFKVAVLPLLALKSPHAAALGAVNVVMPLRGGPADAPPLNHANARNHGGPCTAFYGDNTDWRSIHRCIQRVLTPRNAVQPSRTTALVVGAGGMARAAIYALLQLGCRHIFIHNRTRQHALDIARHFDDWAAGAGAPALGRGAGVVGTAAAPGSAVTSSSSTAPPLPPICHVLDSITDPWPAAFQPPTMVVSCVPAVNMDGSRAADFEMPQQWLGSPTGGVVVELAYEPLVTRLVAQLRDFRSNPASPPWVVVDGLAVVAEMAIETFELFTGRMAPQRLMKAVCRRAWEQQQRGLLSPMSL